MKRVLLVMVVGLLILTGCGKEDVKKGITYLEIEELETKLDSDEAFVFVVGKDTCPACIVYKPVLDELVNNKNIDIYYIEVIDGVWSDEKKDQLMDLIKDSIGQEVVGTPTTYIVKNKKAVDVQIGFLEYGQLLDVLQVNDIVAE